MDATSPHQACKPQHLCQPRSRTGGGQEQAEGPAWGPTGELGISRGPGGWLTFGWGKQARCRHRRGSWGAHKQGWKHDRELLCTTGPNPSLAALPRCVCVRIQPWPRWRLLGAGMPAWRRRHSSVPDAGHILSAARAAGCHTGWPCTCATPSRPAVHSRPQRSDAGLRG